MLGEKCSFILQSPRCFKKQNNPLMTKNKITNTSMTGIQTKNLTVVSAGKIWISL
jgi:hypothetical protein